jgi:phosphoribosylformylglycinamidine synthase subunit PurL
MTIAPGLHRELGLTDDELDAIVQRLGREPSHTELAMFSVMWSEHCSYKSSRIHLRGLPTEGPHILVGPGEGAGIIEVAPGVSVAWKIESHNHPSFVEPFNGAATGVGGIVRDILSMGARPIALMDPLRFGPLSDPRTAYLVEGVVHGISNYGNSIGVPTVGGEVVFEDCYAENPLVNVACLGVVEHRLMHGRAEGEGNVVILIGSSTGRDGIGGASVLASAEFDETSSEKRPSVQVGDPFTEKLLIEACLELVKAEVLVGFQDLGAGGIACPTSEMAAKAGTGMHVDLTQVHLREADMEPFEIMISESQERMLAVVEPANVQRTLEICHKWGLAANVVGEVTKSGRVEVIRGTEVLASVPADALAEEGPVYDRATERPEWLERVQSAPMGDDPPDDLERAFLSILGSPAVASKRWVWEQYDHMIFLGTLQGPGGDAAVIRLPDEKATVAITVDGPGRYCYLDPYEGARLAVAEAARNVCAVGGQPLAITNCLNFGNPEKPEVMWQFAEVVRGIGDACRELGTPVTGGNVSFYNETNGRAIYPTPVIGMLGSVADPTRSVGLAFKAPGDAIVLLGETDERDLGGSEYAKIINGAVAGTPPRLDFAREKALHELLQAGARAKLLSSAHDCSQGGVAVALAESALAGSVGFRVEIPGSEPHRALFAESPSRAVVSCEPKSVEALLRLADDCGVTAAEVGTVASDVFDLGTFSVSADVVNEVFENAFEAALTTRVG